jgi:hypothetical protein
MMRFFALLLVAALAACAPMPNKVDSGNKTVGERMVLKPDVAWNELPGGEPVHVWTMEGVPIDTLLIYSGIKDGQAIHPVASGSESKSFRFHSTMQADEIVSMFEGYFTRDGSTFELARLEPASFGGGKGFRFEYTRTRKADNVPLQGLGFATVNAGQLFAILYNAPRLTFFPRYEPTVEQLAQSARILAAPAAPVAAAPVANQAARDSQLGRGPPCATPMECQSRGVGR